MLLPELSISAILETNNFVHEKAFLTGLPFTFSAYSIGCVWFTNPKLIQLARRVLTITC